MNKYEDMLDMKRPVSKKHPPMPIKDRAAQFAPFAALSGHREAFLKMFTECIFFNYIEIYFVTYFSFNSATLFPYTSLRFC